MKVDALASEPHYLDHLMPIWEALPRHLKGAAFFDTTSRLYKKYGRGDCVLVASYTDLRKVRHMPAILASHGIGQSYAGDPASAEHPAYPGGNDHENVILFLCPNEQCAYKWSNAYPGAIAAVVGYPKLDSYFKIRPTIQRRHTDSPTVGFAFNQDIHICPETRTAFNWYAKALVKASRLGSVFVTGHPRKIGYYRDCVVKEAIPVEPDFFNILLAADVMCVDNSSIGWELMALGMPIVWLNTPEYRLNVEHGLRFWEWADSGVICDDPTNLMEAVAQANADSPEQQANRELAIKALFPFQDHLSAYRAARAIQQVIEEGV